MIRVIHRLRSARAVRTGGAVAAFFSLKFGIGLVLIGASTAFLDEAEFVAFSQLFLLFALLSTISAAGVQNGLTRQVAVARGLAADEQRAASAAFGIWTVASLILLVVITLLRGPISVLLVGDRSLEALVPVVAIAAAGGGFGVLACAILNGRQRAPTSLMLQSAGMAIGGPLCMWRLAEGDAQGAVLGYAAGPLITSALAAAVLRATGIVFSKGGEGRRAEIRLLLSFSLTFLAIAVIMPSTLFALRYFYREAFGAEFLGYWLVANRVSDVTSQILGLYMAQIFLPQVAHETDPRRLRKVVAQTLAIGSAVMLGGWAVFLLGAQFLVATFLSISYLPAIPFIAGYLLGDGLRVTTSMTMHLMMARGRLRAAIGIEAATAALLTAYVVVLAALGRPEAPYWSYPAAYASMAAIIGVIAVTKRGKSGFSCHS